MRCSSILPCPTHFLWTNWSLSRRDLIQSSPSLITPSAVMTTPSSFKLTIALKCSVFCCRKARKAKTCPMRRIWWGPKRKWLEKRSRQRLMRRSRENRRCKLLNSLRNNWQLKPSPYKNKKSRTSKQQNQSTPRAKPTDKLSKPLWQTSSSKANKDTYKSSKTTSN